MRIIRPRIRRVPEASYHQEGSDITQATNRSKSFLIPVGSPPQPPPADFSSRSGLPASDRHEPRGTGSWVVTETNRESYPCNHRTTDLEGGMEGCVIGDADNEGMDGVRGGDGAVRVPSKARLAGD